MKDSIDIKNLPQEPYKPLAKTARQAAADGCVLLKNDGNVLPLKEKEKFSLFGRGQIDYYRSGTGSGGAVKPPYTINILEGIESNNKLTLNAELAEVYKKWIEENPFDKGGGWAQEPWHQKEMVPSEETVRKARECSETAVIVIGRTAGEDKDNAAEKGSWYLTDDEETLLELVTKHFEKTAVLLNVGNIIDMSWVEKYGIKAVMYIWQGGQEGGRAVADLLCGDVTPSGKLADTIAKDINMYPGIKNFGGEEYNLYEEDIYVGYRYFETFAKDDVLYPFGFGLSYTEFDRRVSSVYEKDGNIHIDISVKNIGSYSGRDVIEVYFKAPQGKLGKSERELCAFKKTKLLAMGEEENIHIEFPISQMAAYDDKGATGHKSCYVLEKGEYGIYVGGCVRCAELVYTHTENDTAVVRQCKEAFAPMRSFKVMYPKENNGKYDAAYRDVSLRTVSYKQRIKDELPDDIPYTGDKGIKLTDVKNGKNTMDEFVAQLSDTDLIHFAKGEGMSSPKVRPGSTGAIGGLTESLNKFGIPIIALHDGPSGIRIANDEVTTSLPNGTAIACTWDTNLAEQLYEKLSIEMCTHRIDVILGPGINIHRVPLNGRNFEYLSEDPYLTGKMAAALVRGVRNYGNSATIKHFAANSQEKARNSADSVLSERAAREIYLKGFEYAVKEGGATSVMTSYNPANGRMTVHNYELNTTILRDEWGFEGFVMSDWWPRIADEEAKELNLRDMVEAQNDVYMLAADVTGKIGTFTLHSGYIICTDNLYSALENGTLTRGQLQRNAKNVLRYLMNSGAMERFIECGGRMQKSLIGEKDSLDTVVTAENIESGKETEISLPESGKFLLCIRYSSAESELSQMTISVKINGVSADAVTVNGTKGGAVTVYRDISVSNRQIKLMIDYPDKLMKISQVEIRG